MSSRSLQSGDHQSIASSRITGDGSSNARMNGAHVLRSFTVAASRRYISSRTIIDASFRRVVDGVAKVSIAHVAEQDALPADLPAAGRRLLTSLQDVAEHRLGEQPIGDPGIGQRFQRGHDRLGPVREPPELPYPTEDRAGARLQRPVREERQKRPQMLECHHRPGRSGSFSE